MHRLAHRRPLVFSGLVTVAFVLLLLVTSIAAQTRDDPIAQQTWSTVGRLVITWLGAALLLWLGWHDEAGLPGKSKPYAWLLTLPPMVYLLLVYPPLFTGGYGLDLSEPRLSAAVATNVAAAGVMEEVVFRGIVLTALLRLWGRRGGGLLRALVVSSALFSAPHLLNLLAGNDLAFTLAQLVWAFLLGGVFGALVIATGSLWTAATVHAVCNAVMHLNRLGETVTPSTLTAVGLALAPLPLVVYGWWLLQTAHDRDALPPA